MDAFVNHQSVMVQMPTGTGKTLVLGEIVRLSLQHGLSNEAVHHEVRPDTEDVPCPSLNVKTEQTSTVLIVAHRRELIDQIRKTVKKLGIDDEHVWVESIQTVARRLHNNLLPANVGLVVIDEAHHALAKTYKWLWEAWPYAKFLGLTATPYRMNGEGFGDLFETLILSPHVGRFIAEGWLSPFDFYSIRKDCQEAQAIRQLKRRNADGDYHTKEMKDALDVRPTIDKLYNSVDRFAHGKKGIVYAIDIAHAEHIAQVYRQKGLKAVAISSSTPKRERTELIEKFKAGDIHVLVNVDLFSEGFDCPDVEFIQLARPTLSLAKYLQMAGRGLRRFEEKECCIMLDNVGLYGQFGLPSEDRDWNACFDGLDGQMAQNHALMMSLRWAEDAWDAEGMSEPNPNLEMVKIVCHERLAMLAETSREIVKQGNAWVDLVNGLRFKRKPMVMLFRNVELATEDGERFFPRIRSPFITSNKAISRRCLEMQNGFGIFWQRLFIPKNCPDQVFELEKVMQSGMRLFHDENGALFFQLSPDEPIHRLDKTQNTDVMKKAQSRVDVFQNIWKQEAEERKSIYIGLKQDVHEIPSYNMEETEHGIMHVVLKDGQECWMDLMSEFLHYSKPLLFKRGFLELLKEGDMVFVRNVPGLTQIPLKNYMVCADDEVCVIGNLLYLKQEHCMGAYKVKYRSDDFTFFLTAPNYSRCDMDADIEITHLPGCKPNVRVLLK